MRPIQTDEKNTVLPTNDSDAGAGADAGADADSDADSDADASANAKEAWSDMIVRIDNHMLIPENRKMLVRCETNIFNLYRGAAEAEIKINDDSIWMHGHGGKVSPTTDQRSSSTSLRGGDPDNSALQAGAVRLFGCPLKTHILLLQLLCLLLITTASAQS